MKGRWYILRDEASWSLTRRVPVRWDLRAEGLLPICHPIRLMHQIRQDVWRALQALRGFAPAVALDVQDAGWHVTAGGAALGQVADVWTARLQEVLSEPAHQARWVRHAGPWELRA